MSRTWTVSEVARIAGVSVRTLHHYDEIGLLVPSSRSASGYRLYAPSDLERLQQIAIYRALGFGLTAIAAVLDATAGDRRRALEAQRDLLHERRRATDAMIRAVERAIDALGGARAMDEERMFEGFEPLAEDAPEEVRAAHAEHAREAHERWGETDAYRTSMRRARSYGRREWERIRAEAEETERRMEELLRGGADPEGEEAMAGAEAMRAHIERWFYPCAPEMHVGLADMYESDARFRAHYDERAPGLATFVARAIRANARR